MSENGSEYMLVLWDKAKKYMSDREMSQNAFAKKAGLNKTMMSNFMNKRFDQVNEDAQVKLNAILRTNKIQLIETGNWVRIWNLCRETHEDYTMRGIAAPPGFGKSRALEHYAAYHKNVHYLMVTETMTRLSFTQALGTLGFHLPQRASIEAMTEFLAKKLVGHMILIDDLSKGKSEVIGRIQHLFDLNFEKMAFVVAGTPDLRSKITTGTELNWPAFGQFDDRIVYWQELYPPTAEEVRQLALQAEIKNPECLDFLHSRARNFRVLCDKYLAMALKHKRRGHDINDVEVLKNLNVE